jgi:hypothetical protein
VLNPFASYHIPATPAVSCDYALFCATARRHPSYFQWFPHSFDRHGGVLPPQRSFRDLAASVPRWQIPCSQRLAASLSSLRALFRAPFLCFQYFAASFAKTPGWEGCRISNAIYGTNSRFHPSLFLCGLCASVANRIPAEASNRSAPERDFVHRPDPSGGRRQVHSQVAHVEQAHVNNFRVERQRNIGEQKWARVSDVRIGR